MPTVREMVIRVVMPEMDSWHMRDGMDFDRLEPHPDVDIISDTVREATVKELDSLGLLDQYFAEAHASIATSPAKA